MCERNRAVPPPAQQISLEPDSSQTWWKADRARRATRIAVGIWFFMLMALVGLMLLAGTEPPSDRLPARLLPLLTCINDRLLIFG